MSEQEIHSAACRLARDEMHKCIEQGKYDGIDEVSLELVYANLVAEYKKILMEQEEEIRR